MFCFSRYGGFAFGMPLPADLKMDITTVPKNRTLSKVTFSHCFPALFLIIRLIAVLISCQELKPDVLTKRVYSVHGNGAELLHHHFHHKYALLQELCQRR